MITLIMFLFLFLFFTSMHYFESVILFSTFTIFGKHASVVVYDQLSIKLVFGNDEPFMKIHE